MMKNESIKKCLVTLTNQINRQRSSIRSNALFGAMLLPLIACTPVHAETWTVPTITDVQFSRNDCNVWIADVTLSAAPYAESEVRSWNWNFPLYSRLQHLHQGDDGLSYETNLIFNSSLEDIRGRLNEVNRAVFHQDNPPVGTSTVVYHFHNGKCAADYGNQECIGVFLGNVKTNNLPQGGRPITIPAGMCWKVPTPNSYCEWGDLSLTIDHGTVHRNKENIASAKTKITCHRTTTYSVKLVKPIEDVTLLINDKPLENMFQGTISGEQDITFTSIIKPSVTGSFRRSGVLLVSPE